MKFFPSLFLAAAFAVTTPAIAQSVGSPFIDFAGYTSLAAEVQEYRASRLITLADFRAKGAKPDVLILDARSSQAFAEGHIDGAVNLPLPDFNDQSLAELIGDNANREILIYCNNNFTNNLRPIPLKRMQLALNIQTFINLYGYGYKNVYELGEAVDRYMPEVEWVGDKDAQLMVVR